jgi:hypothetical protein
MYFSNEPKKQNSSLKTSADVSQFTIQNQVTSQAVNQNQIQTANQSFDEYLSETVFIGDSRTNGLSVFKYITEDSYVCTCNIIDTGSCSLFEKSV